jgi:amino acid transporter
VDYSTVKRLLIGRPLASDEADSERLSKVLALPVFATDAIASTAFATEQILVVLVPVAGMAALGYLVPISWLVVALLAVVVASYRQTLYAYPNGGGSYIVSRENLGTRTSLVAGASLLVDYTLTVAVSIAAGVAAIGSAVPYVRDHRVPTALVILAIITFANLRGARESGRLFAPPTYGYVVAMTAMVVIGLVEYATGHLQTLPVDQAALDEVTHGGVLTGVTFFLLMRAFSSGAVALSGVEAISNGIQAFRPPESRNASITLLWAATILGGLFMGIAFLAVRLQPTLSGDQTILSQMGRAVFGDGPVYLVFQALTVAVLTLSANTAFADFPRLSSIMARDGFLPRQLANRGDRLVHSNGIIALATAVAVLLIGFGGDTAALVPLFAVGLFMSFTLSQAGMVRHHWRLREPRWSISIVINGVGATATAVVLAVIVISKFTEGAWISVVVIILLVVFFMGISHHYRRVAEDIAVSPGQPLPEIHHSVVVLVGSRMHKGVLEAVAYAKSLHPDHLEAVTVAVEDDDADQTRANWDAFDLDVPLHVLPSPFRGLSRPILDYLEELDARYDNDVVTVIIPELVVSRWWEQPLHNQSAIWLRARLRSRHNLVVTSVPLHLEHHSS